MTLVRETYRLRLDARSAATVRLRRWHGGMWWAQVAASGLLALVLILAAQHETAAAWVFLPVGGLIAAYAAERELGRLKNRSARAAAMYGAALARLDGRWEAVPFTGTEFVPADHVNAFDLDIVGERSLFARLNTARTRMGARELASWLLEPADQETRLRRQEAVSELQGRLDLREALHTAGPDGVAHIDEDLVRAWASGDVHLPWPWARVPLRVAAWSVVVASAGAAAGWWSVSFLVAAVATTALVHMLLRARVNAVVVGALEPLRQLSVTAAVMAELEKEAFRSRMLRELQGVLLRGGRASKHVARLDRLVAGLLAMQADVIAVIGFPLLWPARKALGVEAWRRAHGSDIASWMRAVGAFEALCSVATWCDEHPTYRQAEVVADGPVFEAEGLGHPLLPDGRCVLNDVNLGGLGPRLLPLSGSNMSGKSTLIRAVGMTVAMGLAGIPVRATRLKLSATRVGASIRVRDSVVHGESRFYAELKRLKQVVGLVEASLPVFFLFDEILGGTNSHDRLAGASGLLVGLIRRGAIGICSTHDLALAGIAVELGARAMNAHFADRVEGDRLVFDYKLQPGVSRRTNAMELMLAMGIRA